jgi:hypothetical protein
MTPAGIEPATFRFVAQYVNHCATALPHIYIYICVYIMYVCMYMDVSGELYAFVYVNLETAGGVRVAVICDHGNSIGVLPYGGSVF